MNEKTPLFIGFEDLEPDWDAFRRINPMGVVLFQRNLESLEQIKELCTRIHSEIPGVVIAIDQEGGRVNRLAHLLPAFPAPPHWKTSEQTQEAGKVMGQMLRYLDIDMNFAPAIDLDYGHDDNALQGRLLGDDATTVATLADAYLTGLAEAGCMGCVKHFPGLGSTVVDSHLLLPTMDLSVETWITHEAEVYRQLFNMGWQDIPVMMAHCQIPFWGNEIASSSPHAVNALRSFGSTGMLITDDLEMKAVPEIELEAYCKRAIQAGVDALMVCRSLEKAERMAQWVKGVPNTALQKLGTHRASVADGVKNFNIVMEDWEAFSSSC